MYLLLILMLMLDYKYKVILVHRFSNVFYVINSSKGFQKPPSNCRVKKISRSRLNLGANGKFSLHSMCLDQPLDLKGKIMRSLHFIFVIMHCSSSYLHLLGMCLCSCDHLVIIVTIIII